MDRLLPSHDDIFKPWLGRGLDGADDNDGGAPGSGGGGGIDELTGEVTDRNGQHHPIAEFLYQLTKMLTDDNTEVIEWSDGRIKVHHPERLEAEVLHKYFRHSKVRSMRDRSCTVAVVVVDCFC